MVDTKSPGDKTLSVPTKTLTLKPRVETGTVRQSFSHGRTKQVVVEKRGKRRVPGEAPATETPAAEPAAKAAPAKAPLTRPATPSAQPREDLERPIVRRRLDEHALATGELLGKEYEALE
jgi:translation initiation factor IF-2